MAQQVAATALTRERFLELPIARGWEVSGTAELTVRERRTNAARMSFF
jgi:hypothetical protein